MMRKNNGMSLTEVVFSMALVAVAIGSILAVVFQSVDFARSSKNMYIASTIAKNRIERIRQIRKDDGYAVLPQAAETDVLLDRNGAADPNGDFRRTTVIDAGYAANLTKVTVSVSYKRRGVFIPAEVTLITLISPYA